MILRDYQQAAYDATHEAFKTHSRVLDVLPTGTGKTVLFGKLAGDWPEGRVLVVAPMIELIGQAAKKICKITGCMPAIEQADNWSNESEWARNPFIVGSKQTLTSRSKRYKRFVDVGLVILDEADTLLTAPVAEMVDYFVDKGAKLLGVTATAQRGDGKAMKNMYETCAYQMGISEAIPLGWLIAPRAHCIQLESLDLSEVGTKSATGDFKDGELAKAMEDDKVICEVAEVTAAESVGLKTVVYCASVDEARKVAYRLVDTHHLKADWVCGDTRLCDESRRREVIRSFTEDADGIQIVCNVGVLTRGWDFPGLQHIVMARPTKSLNLFTQIMGRGTRPLEGTVDFEGSTPESRREAIANSAKPFFKVTDLRDNGLEHKLISTADVLAGKMGLEVVKAAKKKLAEAGKALDVAEVLEEAQSEFDTKERKRLAKLAAKAKYKKVETDLFDDHQRGKAVKSGPKVVRMILGKYKGQPLAEIPTDYLQHMVRENKVSAPWLRGAMYGEINRRHKHAAPPAAAAANGSSSVAFWSKFNELRKAT
jgi:superfamily II DNA or RNA helicase